MIIIGETVVEDGLASEQFACDLSECEGACCTLPGGRGAPLEDDEVAELEKAYPFVRQYLTASRRTTIEQSGMVEGGPGHFATSCVDDRDCVFVFYEGAVARCAIERAYFDGRIDWRKPLSCHLFPVRVSSGSISQVRYEKTSECRPARENGRNSHMPLYIFLKEALVRRFGEVWYDAFCHECERRNDPSPSPRVFKQSSYDQLTE